MSVSMSAGFPVSRARASLAVAASALVVGMGLFAGGCVYHLPTRQGNILEQKTINQLKVGMTRDQVRFLMGTPIADSSLRRDRWDYVAYYKSPRYEISKRVVTLEFDGDTLATIVGGDDPETAASRVDKRDEAAAIRESTRRTTTPNPTLTPNG